MSSTATASTEMVFRSGSTKTIQPGSWIVNCTGYIGRDSGHPYEPYVSDSGAVVSIQPRSSTLHLPAFQGYFLTHLLFLDKIKDVPLYELDLEELRQKSSAVFPYALFTLVQHNLSLIYDNVPTRVFSDNGLDFDTWYPLPRRAPSTGKVHAHPPPHAGALAARPRHRARTVRCSMRPAGSRRTGGWRTSPAVDRPPISHLAALVTLVDHE